MKRKIIPLILPHNYCIVAPQGLPWACRCDELTIENSGSEPPPESYPTIDEAIDRLQVLFEEVAKKTFHPRLLAQLPPEAITVKVVLFDSILAGVQNPKPVTKKRIIKEFKQHPSVPIVGIVKFWESDHAHISCLLQGQKEIQAWLQSPEAQEISGVVKSIGAEAITVSGIHVT